MDVPKPLIMCMDRELYSSNSSSMPDPCLENDMVFMISIVSQRYLTPERKYLLNVGQCEIRIDNVSTNEIFNKKRNVRRIIHAY